MYWSTLTILFVNNDVALRIAEWWRDMILFHLFYLPSNGDCTEARVFYGEPTTHKGPYNVGHHTCVAWNKVLTQESFHFPDKKVKKKKKWKKKGKMKEAIQIEWFGHSDHCDVDGGENW